MADSAPAVLMTSGCAYSANSLEIRAAASECAIVQPLLAWQDADRLFIRRLMLAPMTKQRAPTGSKRRVRFEFGGYVVGCVLQGAMQFARGRGRTMDEAMSVLRQCLGSASADLARCTGCDAVELRLGMAQRRVLRDALASMDTQLAEFERQVAATSSKRRRR